MFKNLLPALFTLVAMAASAQQMPDLMIERLSDEVIAAVKSNRGSKSEDLQAVLTLVNTTILPHVDLERMTASAVGRYWRQATAEQRLALQEQYKTLLVRTYAGALTQITDQTVDVRPVDVKPSDMDIVVRTEVHGAGQPVQLDYRLERTPSSWKIYDLSVMGIWLAENYRNSFADEINNSGIDGLVAKLRERNQPRSNG
jgi:phospholipid transport system substrate-binding protein